MHSCSVATIHLDECCIPPYLACVYMCMVTNIQHSSHNNKTFSTHMGISNGDGIGIGIYGILLVFKWLFIMICNHKV